MNHVRSIITPLSTSTPASLWARETSACGFIWNDACGYNHVKARLYFFPFSFEPKCPARNGSIHPCFCLTSRVPRLELRVSTCGTNEGNRLAGSASAPCASHGPVFFGPRLPLEVISGFFKALLGLGKPSLLLSRTCTSVCQRRPDGPSN